MTVTLPEQRQYLTHVDPDGAHWLEGNTHVDPDGAHWLEGNTHVDPDGAHWLEGNMDLATLPAFLLC